jgi:hypothetical protein
MFWELKGEGYGSVGHSSSDLQAIFKRSSSDLQAIFKRSSNDLHAMLKPCSSDAQAMFKRLISLDFDYLDL